MSRPIAPKEVVIPCRSELQKKRLIRRLKKRYEIKINKNVIYAKKKGIKLDE